MAKPASDDRARAQDSLVKAARDWKAAKRSERAARDALAAIVVAIVRQGVLTENKVASVTEIPRMTIRKMLGKA